MRTAKTVFFILFASAGVGWLCYNFWLAYQPVSPIIQGQIEAQQYSISSKVPGRIDQILIKKGESIQKGQLVFTIHSPEIEAKLEQAKAGEDAAQAMSEQAQKGAREQEIAASRDKWQMAKAATELLDKTSKRIENLYIGGGVAEQKMDEAKTKLKAARFTENAAFQLCQMAKEGAREATKKSCCRQGPHGSRCCCRSRGLCG